MNEKFNMHKDVHYVCVFQILKDKFVEWQRDGITQLPVVDLMYEACKFASDLLKTQDPPNEVTNEIKKLESRVAGKDDAMLISEIASGIINETGLWDNMNYSEIYLKINEYWKDHRLNYIFVSAAQNALDLGFNFFELFLHGVRLHKSKHNHQANDEAKQVDIEASESSLIRHEIVNVNERMDIIVELKNILRNNKMREIMEKVKEMINEKKLEKLDSPKEIYNEFVKLGMPKDIPGFGYHNFYNYYKIFLV